MKMILLLTFWALLISTSWAAEVRFYAVKDSTDEINSYTATIGDLVALGRQKKLSESSGTQLPLGSEKAKQSTQCSMLHKLFKKYKRELNSDQSMAEESWQSVTSVAYLKVRDAQGGSRIPLGVRANITKNLIGCDNIKGPEHDKFTFSKKQSKAQMEATAHNSDDKPGRLIPQSLCGPAKWYNFAPLAPNAWELMEKHEDNVDKWALTEALLKQWMTGESGQFEMLVVLVYKDLRMSRRNAQAPNFNKRPTGFATCHRLYDSRGNVKAERFLFLENK